jgi:serine/threonine protein kinase
MVGWIIASETAEEMKSFLDELCVAGCLVRDLPSHFAFLDKDEAEEYEPCEPLRLGRPTSSRTSTTASVMALKVATTSEKMSQLRDEAQVLMNIQHDAIVCAFGIYEVKVNDERALGMVLDYKPGIDLTYWIPSEGLPERVVRGIVAQLCDALVYLHEILVVHRDIKPSNIFCERAQDGSMKVVLADFGLATHALDKKMSARCGTGGFVAPEMFQNGWPGIVQEVTDLLKIDVFSFGMLVYVALFGNNPFSDATIDATYQRNARCVLSFTNMGGRSDELKSLLSGICAKSPRMRYSSSEILAHPWLSADLGVPFSGEEVKTTTVTWAAFEQATRYRAFAHSEHRTQSHIGLEEDFLRKAH